MSNTSQTKITKSTKSWNTFANISSWNNPNLPTDVKYMRWMECGGGGDCMFFAIAEALNQQLKKPDWTMQKVRNLASSLVTEKNVDEMLNEYAQMEIKSEKFDPATILKEQDIKKRIEQLQKAIITPGWTFEGDDLILKHLLGHAPFSDIGFVVLSCFNQLRKVDPKLAKTKDEKVLCFCPRVSVIKNDKSKWFISLYNLRNVHWQLLGCETIKDKKRVVLCCFSEDMFPKIWKDWML